VILNKSPGATAIPGDLQLLGGSTASSTVVLSLASDQIADTSNVSLLNATLQLDGAHEAFHDLTLTTSTLTGSGDVTVTGVFTNTSGGLSGSGTLNIASGATANFPFNSAPQRTINNSGTFNLPPSGGSGIGGGGGGKLHPQQSHRRCR
jgi:hypothetical protein